MKSLLFNNKIINVPKFSKDSEFRHDRVWNIKF